MTISAVLAVAVSVTIASVAVGQSPSAGVSPAADGPVTLTLLHNNDGESSLLPITYSVPDARGGEIATPLDIGGIAAFAAVTEREVEDARAAGNAVVNLYAGDAFLAGSVLSCSLPPQPADTPVYDALAQSLIPYDVHIIGNHEFDYGPDLLERFVRTFARPDGVPNQPFLSANLDFSGEPAWAQLVEPNGRIDGEPVDGRVVARSAIVHDEATGAAFGIVGATTWTLPTISSPREVKVTPDLPTTAAAVQAEVDALLAAGVDRIILASHLQDVDNDMALVAALRGVDIAVAGGGDELLLAQGVDPDAQLLPGEAQEPAGDYPTMQQDLDGRSVPIVTTAGNYKYLGRLDVTFDAEGEIEGVVSESSYPRRVIPDAQDEDALNDLGITDAVTPDPDQVAEVVNPVSACLDAFAQTPVAVSEVVLNVARGDSDPYALGVRSGETNGGNLVADSYLHAYDVYGPSTGFGPRSELTHLVVAVQNGGGIRQGAGNELPQGGAVPGIITRLDTLGVMAFDNRLVTVDLVNEEVLRMLDQSCGSIGGGGFLQVAALAYTCDLTQPEGSRAVDVRFTGGTPATEDDVPIEAIEGADVDQTTIRVITNHFTAAGGDGYDVLADKTPTTLVNEESEPVFYEQAFREYLESFPLAGDDQVPTIPASDPRYAAKTGEGRITIIGGPADAATSAPSLQPVAFALTSDAFADGEAIPERYTCDGRDVSPPLAWVGVPAGTASLAIVVADPDADGWAHWVAFDIDPTLSGLPEGASGSGVFTEGMNEFPSAGWAGPCPPEGTEHAYGFGLFALDTMLGLDETATAEDLRAAMDGHILARTELSGTRAR
jgi:5'-nucleotidase